jgi:hypothetical protein
MGEKTGFCYYLLTQFSRRQILINISISAVGRRGQEFDGQAVSCLEAEQKEER